MEDKKREGCRRRNIRKREKVYVTCGVNTATAVKLLINNKIGNQLTTVVL